LVAGEGEGALAVEVFVDGVEVSGDGFGFGEHKVFAVCE
jgi:hypothetical protein